METNETKPKAAKTPSVDLFGLNSEKFESMKGIGDIMAHLEKGEWAEFVTAISALFTEFFGTPEQKAELAKARKEAQNDKTKKDTKKNLDKLHSKVDKKKEDEKEKRIELVDKPKLGSGRDIVLIGDSIPKGMSNEVHGWTESPMAIAQSGLPTKRVLELLRSKQSLLTGKKRAIIHCGANNILSSPKKLAEHIIEMAKICHKHEVREIIIASQFPVDPRRKPKQKIIDANAALLKELINAKERGDLPSSVRIVDLIKAFGNEKGEMREKYVDRKVNNPSHPESAYGAALDYLLRGSKTKKS